MKIKLLMAIVLLSCIAYGQKYLDLYKNHLPQKMTQWDTETKEMINSQLEGKILLNPNLAYSFIEYLSKRYGESILNEDENLLNYHRALTAKQYKDRNRWIEREISDTRKNYPFTTAKAQVIRFLNSFKAEEMKSPESKVTFVPDENLEAFYTVIYLTNNPELKYLPEENYRKIVESCLTDSLKKAIDELQLFKNGISGSRSDIREKIVSLWYAFDKYAAHLPPPYNKNAYDYLIELGEVTARLPNTFEVNFVSAFNFNNTIGIKESYYLPEIPEKITVSKDYNTLQYSVGLNLKFYLSSSKSIFSNVSVEGSYNHSIIKKREIIDQPYKGNMYNPNSYLTLNENEFYLKSVSTIMAKIITPLYFYNDNFSLDAGVILLYNSLLYEWKGKYAFEVKSDDGDVLFQRKRTYANDVRSVTRLSILPVLDISFNYLDPLVIKMSGNHKFAGLAFQYNLHPSLLEYFYER